MTAGILYGRPTENPYNTILEAMYVMLHELPDFSFSPAGSSSSRGSLSVTTRGSLSIGSRGSFSAITGGHVKTGTRGSLSSGNSTYTFFYLKFYLATSSPPPSPPHRRGNHPPCLAEATVRPEDVFLVLVTAPVLIGSGASASAVLREGGGGIDLVGKEKKSGFEDIVTLFPRKRLFYFSTLFSEDPCNSSGNHLFIAFPIHCDNKGKKVIQAFIGQHKCNAFLWRHLPVSILRTHFLPGFLNPGRGQVTADGGRL